MSPRAEAADISRGWTGLAASGLAGAALFTATWIVAGLADPAFSFVDNDTSDLGALTAAHPTPYNIGVSLSGLLTIGVAVALVRVFGRRRSVIAGAVLVAVFGAGQFIDGLAREDCPVSVNAVCRAAEKAGRVSMHHKIHNAESLVTFSALMLAPLVVGLALRSKAGWRGLALWSIAAAVVQIVCLPIFLGMYSDGTHGQGVVEIIELTAGVAWIAAVSIACLKLWSRPVPRT
jgi:hypothetical membrane protein